MLFSKNKAQAKLSHKPTKGFEINLSEVDDDILLAAKEEAEKQLKELHTTEQVIMSKATGLIQILFPVLIGLFGYCMDRYLKNQKVDLLIVVAFLEVVILMCSCIFLFMIFKSERISIIGCKPENLLTQRLFKHSKGAKKSYLVTMIYSYHEAIKKTEDINTRRSLLFDYAYLSLALGTLFILLASLLLFVLSQIALSH